MRRQGTEQSLDLTRFPSWGPASPAPSPSHSASRNLSGSALDSFPSPPGWMVSVLCDKWPVTGETGTGEDRAALGVGTLVFMSVYTMDVCEAEVPWRRRV